MKTQLKNVRFEYYEEKKVFSIFKDYEEGDRKVIFLTRPEAQSFARFVFRVVIRYFYPKKYLKK